MSERQGGSSDLRVEATQLLDVLLERLSVTRQLLGDQPSDGDAATAAEENSTEGGVRQVCPTCGHDSREVSCSGCPLCALLAMLRGDRPELTAKLIDGALSALQGIRGLVAEPTPSAAGDPSEPDHSDRPAESPSAERIDIR